VGWLATKTDKTATCRLVRIDWRTVGRIIKRVGDELIDYGRLQNLYEISIDEVAWRKGHRCLTLIGDHRRGRVVWGCEGKGQAAADEFFTALDPPLEDPPESARQPHRWAPEPAIMVPFGPCPTVPAGEGIPGAWLQAGRELDPRLLARASRLTAVSMDMTGGCRLRPGSRPAGDDRDRQLSRLSPVARYLKSSSWLVGFSRDCWGSRVGGF
jgi:hypothetical protein